MDGIRYIGDPTAAYSYASIKGAFNIYHDYDDFEYPTDLDFTVRDYGGLGGEVKTVEKRLHIVVPFEDCATGPVPNNPQNRIYYSTIIS